jgi:Subtilase family/Bacterial Ig-like domain (group 3)
MQASHFNSIVSVELHRKSLVTQYRVLLFVIVFLLGLSSQAGAASWPIIVQIAPAASINSIATQLQGSVVDCIPDCSSPSANPYLLNVPVLPSPARASALGIQWYELNKKVGLPRFYLRPDAAGKFVLSGPARAAADWYKAQPAMQLVNAAKALTVSTGRGVVVAEINSKLDYAHPALSGHLTGGQDFIASRATGFAALADQSDAGFLDQSDAGFLDQSDAGFLDQSDAGFLDLSNPASLDGLSPAYSHGSLSAGIIAAIAPDSMIMPLHAFDDDGHSDYFTLAKAIRYAVDHGAQIINLNFGIKYASFSVAVQNAVQSAQTSNVLLVAPAGNDHTFQTQYPAAYAGVMAAAATTVSDNLALFSNYGTDVFVDAPGVDMISAYPGGYYAIASGTTLSAAAVAGTAALVRSLRMNGVSDSIAQTAVSINSENPTYQNQLGHGRIDAFGAVLSSREPTTTSITAPAAVTYGTRALVTVTVSSPTSPVGVPTGKVSLAVDGGTAVSTPLSNGSATFMINGLNAGDHMLAANYVAQSAFMASSAKGSLLHINPAPTTVTVTSTPDPSAFGQSVLLTATVNSTSPGAGIPPGAVTFYDGPAAIGNGALNAAGVATFGISALSVGAHAITASYGATTNFTASTSATVAQTVKKANTSAIVGSSLNPSRVKTAVTFTASVSAVLPGAGIPTGKITFTDCKLHQDEGEKGQQVCRKSVILDTVAVNGSGQATLVTSSLAVGMHSITVAYSGDANFTASTSSALTQIIYAYGSGEKDGAFVIGDLEAAVGNKVTFWSARWDKSNALSNGDPPRAFNGYADSTTPRSPTAGGVWTSRPDDRSDPPDAVPRYMAVIVSSSITKSDSKISGNILRMVVVDTASGYDPDRRHHGTGTVVAIIKQ